MKVTSILATLMAAGLVAGAPPNERPTDVQGNPLPEPTAAEVALPPAHGDNDNDKRDQVPPPPKDAKHPKDVKDSGKRDQVPPPPKDAKHPKDIKDSGKRDQVPPPPKDAKHPKDIKDSGKRDQVPPPPKDGKNPKDVKDGKPAPQGN
ncbi:hypothetical protein CBS147311_6623 [Penicillium roqueforti]|nr:hypothetical protein CBS147311_6623 [Penicillium roqueforti]